MRGTAFFLEHYSQKQFETEFGSKSDPVLQIPAHLCAHPNVSYLRHIKECLLIDFVRPYPLDIKLLICICQPTIIDPPIYSTCPFELFEEIHNSWNETFYLPLEDLEICPINEENKCQFRKSHLVEQ